MSKIEIKEIVLGGVNSFRKRNGELVSKRIIDGGLIKLFGTNDIKESWEEMEENDITIVKDPYGIGHDFFGVKGQVYPKDFKELIKFREIRKESSVEEAIEKIEEGIKL